LKKHATLHRTVKKTNSESVWHVEAHEGIKKANAIGKNLCTVHEKKFEILMQIPLVGGEIERS